MSKINDVSKLKTCNDKCDVWKKFPSGRGFIVCNNPYSNHYKHVLSKLHPICNKRYEWLQEIK